jgi:hypothetical protein
MVSQRADRSGDPAKRVCAHIVGRLGGLGRELERPDVVGLGAQDRLRVGEPFGAATRTDHVLNEVEAQRHVARCRVHGRLQARDQLSIRHFTFLPTFARVSADRGQELTPHDA